MIEYCERLADAIEARATGAFDAFLTIYVTKGGTLIIASRGSVTDSGKPRDLAAILPADLRWLLDALTAAEAERDALAALVFGYWRRAIPQGTRQVIVWDKRGGNGFSGDYTMPWADITEQIYVLGKGWTGRRVPAIYSIPSLHSSSPERWGHPTPKPVSLMSELLSKCPPGVIANPFSGSGSTLVAAVKAGRRVIGVEIEEEYCETIARRLSQGILDRE